VETGGLVYDIGITKKNSTEYTGFITSSSSKFWKPNEVKFRLFPNGKYEYYALDKSLKTGNYDVYDNSIIYFREMSIPCKGKS
jgi:hypothetical protein